MNGSSSADALADLLSNAYNSNLLAKMPAALEPANVDDAYDVQQRFLKKCNVGTGGWKVGSKSETAPIHCAPLPLPRIYSSSASIARRDYPVFALELELIFTLDRDFLPQPEPISERHLLESVSAFGASIEIASSRIDGWPDTPKLSQLADLQSHGALVIGDMVEYRSDFSFTAPTVDLRIDGVPLFSGAGRNSAGDPRRLLWGLVNHCSAKGLTLPAGSIITTGSFTGMEFPAHGGTVMGEITGLPAVTFELI
jgi:2-keto-4-pentenoate hydratase